MVRFPYKSGDLKASGPAQTLATLPGGGGHRTRDIVFTPDGKHMLVSVGSHSNDDDSDTTPAEFHRADVLEFTPEGKFEKVYAWGIRNCVGETIHPTTGELWCSTNERDALGNNLVPDYITHVQEDGFYGWPWYYMGGIQDPRQAGKRPELKSKVIVPDVLLNPHFASLELQFYEASQFPSTYHGRGFAAEHGSWNRDPRGGYEVITIPMEGGKATGEYEDFLTGFVLPGRQGVGPAGGHRGGERWIPAGLRRRFEYRLAGELHGSKNSGVRPVAVRTSEWIQIGFAVILAAAAWIQPLFLSSSARAPALEHHAAGDRPLGSGIAGACERRFPAPALCFRPARLAYGRALPGALLADRAIFSGSEPPHRAAPDGL